MKILSLAFTALILTGCSGLNSDFSCDKTASSTCTTVDQANKNAKGFDSANIRPVNVSNQNNNQNNSDFIQTSNTTIIPSRTKENVNRIYISSYIDSNDNFHNEQIIYFAVSSPKWEN